MDMDLKNLLEKHFDTEDKARLYVKTVDNDGVVMIDTGQETIAYKLKPLGELYGTGLNRPGLNPQDEAYMPLLAGIEQEISHLDEASKGRMTDATVLLDLQALAARPEASFPIDNLVAQRVQEALQITLSLNDYSRQDVRQALRRIAKSVAGHTRDGGPRGYLEFIREYVS